MMEEWIEEFLYRGRPPSGPDSNKEPAFHVVIGTQAESPLDPTEKVRKFSPPLSLQAAEDKGWTFSEIIANLNLNLIKRVSELEAVVAEKDAVIAELNKPSE